MKKQSNKAELDMIQQLSEENCKLRKLAKWQCDKLFEYSKQIGELKTKLYYERRI